MPWQSEKIRLAFVNEIDRGARGIPASELGSRFSYGRNAIMERFAAACVQTRIAVPYNEENASWRYLPVKGIGYKTVPKRVGRNPTWRGNTL